MLNKYAMKERGERIWYKSPYILRKILVQNSQAGCEE